ncbi:MAG: hypothetical protein [Olavius algarvensis Gamma 1 endosymbiont]|nr:MAG: hypothetical protein [Olavius algarvensis Gamma 1 endosymbiont]
MLLRVVPGREPSFWYPGALLEEKDDAILVGLVRCPIDVECPIDVVATWHPTHSIVTPVILFSYDSFVEESRVVR